MKQTLAVRAIIKQDEKILLLRRATGNPLYIGLYELPGGKVAFGEDPRASLQREVKEETGREIETMQLYDVHSELDVRDIQHQYIELVFMAVLKPDTTIELESSHDRYVWKKLSEIQLNEVTETTRLALQIEDNAESKDVSTDLDDVKNTANFRKVILYADGGSRGNPGPSASGFVIQDEHEQLIFEGGKYLGITTNNQAEYHAVRLGTEKALELGARDIKIRLDSMLVVNQLNGIYQIKNRDLWPIHARIKELLEHFDTVSIIHIRREYNKEADAMVNKILDEHRQ